MFLWGPPWAPRGAYGGSSFGNAMVVQGGRMLIALIGVQIHSAESVLKIAILCAILDVQIVQKARMLIAPINAPVTGNMHIYV